MRFDLESRKAGNIIAGAEVSIRGARIAGSLIRENWTA